MGARGTGSALSFLVTSFTEIGETANPLCKLLVLDSIGTAGANFPEMRRTAKKRWAARVKLLCAASLLCCVETLPAQQQEAKAEPAPAATGSVSGVVTDTDGSAVPTAQITLEPEQQDQAPATPARTNAADEHGVFSFTAVPEGRYICASPRPASPAGRSKRSSLCTRARPSLCLTYNLASRVSQPR